EKGLRLKPDDTRLILELDHLYQHAGKTEKRFRLYENHKDIIELSDDLVLRYCQLNIKNENFDEAITWMTDHTFFPREANHVEPVVITIYAEAFIGKGIKMLEVENYSEALDLFHKARNFPSNLNDIAPEIFVTTRLDYYTGLALKGIGRKQDANRLWQNSINSPLRKGFECEVYLAKILKETGNNDKAEQLIQNLVILNLEKIKVLTESASLSVAHITLYEAFKMLNEDQKAQIHLKKALDYNKDAILKSRIQAAHVPIIST
ncbi:MAG: tetratricopeptide repeat protein, partial [Bacteroidales bacterium]